MYYHYMHSIGVADESNPPFSSPVSSFLPKRYCIRSYRDKLLINIDSRRLSLAPFMSFIYLPIIIVPALSSTPLMGCGYQLPRLLKRAVFQLELPRSKVKQSSGPLDACASWKVRVKMIRLTLDSFVGGTHESSASSSSSSTPQQP